MKNLTIYTYILLIILVNPLSLAADAARHALILGISDYPEASGFEDVYGKDDAEKVKLFLLSQSFSKENILMRTNEQCTKSDILAGLEELFNKSREGDKVVFYFSGHGMQFVDCSGDEDDERDEGLVPVDFRQGHNNSKDIDGQYLVSDDELNEHFLQIRRRIGSAGHLLVIIDACYSGGILRRDSGGREIGPQLLGRHCETQKKIYSTKDFELNFSTKNEEGLAPLVALLSSQENQKSFAYTGNAIFTKLFLDACNDFANTTTSKSITYIKLINTIRYEMGYQAVASQTPKLWSTRSELTFLFLGTGLYPPLRRGPKRPNSDLVPLQIELNLNNRESEKYLESIWGRKDKFNPSSHNSVSIHESVDRPGQHKHVIKSARGDTIWYGISTTLSPQALDSLYRPLLIRYSKAQQLRDWQSSKEDSPLSFEILVEQPDGKLIPPRGKVIEVGEYINLSIENTGEEPRYWALLEILPTDDVNLVFPERNAAAEYLLKRGETFSLDNPIAMGPPIGIEYLKLIATPKPLPQQWLNALGDDGSIEEFMDILEALRKRSDCTVIDVKFRIVSE